METISKIYSGRFLQLKRQCLARQVLRCDAELGAPVLKTWGWANSHDVVLQFGPEYNIQLPATVRYQTRLVSSSTTIAGTNVRWNNERLGSEEATVRKCALPQASAQTHQLGQLQTSLTGVQQSCHDSNTVATPSFTNLPRMRELGFLRYWTCLAPLWIG